MVQLIESTLTLAMAEPDQRGLPPEALGHFQCWVPKAARQAIAIALRGTSLKRGRKPHWWADVTTLRLLDLSIGDGAVSAVFGAPRLGDVTEGLLSQGIIEGLEEHVWQPSPDATGIDLIATVMADVVAQRQDSTRLDQGMLATAAQTKDFISAQQGFSGLTIPWSSLGADRAAALGPVRCDAEFPQLAQSWQKRTPRPRSAHISGRLTMVDERSSRFALDLDDGKRVYGIYLPGDCSALWQHGQKRVSVFGKVLYRANGQALRFEAEEVAIDPEASAFFSRIPDPEQSWSDQQRSHMGSGPGGLHGLFGLLDDGSEDDEAAFLRAVEAIS